MNPPIVSADSSIHGDSSSSLQPAIEGRENRTGKGQQIRKNRKPVIAVKIIVLILLLIVSCFYGYRSYSWDPVSKDSDDDGVIDKNDLFPNDPKYQTFDDLDFQWVDIIPGTFIMGSSRSEDERDQQPQHQVKISKGFEILKYEVIQAQWEAIMGSNPSFYKGEYNPVENISWNECQTFIMKLDELNPSFNYRLPTEAEWEYCCRAESGTKYGYGDNESRLGNYAWYNHYPYNGSLDAPDRMTHPVGLKYPNTWGLYDMHGNVWEWCQDWYDKSYYEDSPNTDPKGPDSGTHKLARGGSYQDSYSWCVSSFRWCVKPEVRFRHLGVRLVRESA